TQYRRTGVAEDVLEPFAPFDERLAAKIGGARAKDVEGDECRARADVARSGLQMNAALEILETCGLPFGVERDDFAVEDDRLLQPLRPDAKRVRDFWKLIGLLVAQARPQMDAAASGRDFSDRANPVVFRLIDEVRIVQRR